MTFKLDMIQTASLAVVVLLFGKFIKRKLPLLDKYCIPEPVIGGLLFAILMLIFKQTGILILDMDATLQSFFMTAFFTTVGFTASFKLLKKGGLQVLIFLSICIVLIFLQNMVGIFFAKVFNLNPLIGICTASVPLVGGLGTSGAFGPLFESAGAVGATTVAIASATFGLIMGSIIGGPISKRLIEKNNLVNLYSNFGNDYDEIASTYESAVTELVPNNFMNATTEIFLAMGLGTIISLLLKMSGMTFPPYIGAMFAAAIIRNLSDGTKAFEIYEDEIDIIGNVALSLFLSMALMSLKLWQLADLALPLIVMLIAQTIVMIIFAYYITFYFMGKDYEAAVISSATCGFGMGSTANAMANMDAITNKYGPAPKAFFIVPLVGSLFIDFFNAGIVTLFMNFFTK
ncbi:MAG: sodium/glutamate symporter [Clostridium sp.]|uniref:sodium/glutamate symporter n=1 Tax=Clostridium sp. TaxID=1506 RepID=UPI0030394EF3